MPHQDNVSEPRVDTGDRDLVAMGRTAFLTGDVDRAKRLADEAINLDPLRQDACILKGRALVCLFNDAGAKECYDQAIEIDDTNKEAWARKAFAHRVNGELSEAIACLNRALELGGEDHRILNDIASAHDDLGEFSLAISFYERALDVNPGDAFASENIKLNQKILDRIGKM